MDFEANGYKNCIGLEEIPYGAFIQQRDGALTAVNSAALAIFGLTKEEFLGRTSHDPAWDVVAEDGAKLIAAEHPSLQALTTGKAVHQRVLGVINARTKGRVWLEISAIPECRPSESQPYRVLVILNDITEKRRQIKLNQTLLNSLPCVALLLRPHTREIVAGNAAAVKVGAVPGKTCYATWAGRNSPCPWCQAPELWTSGKPQHCEVEYQGIYYDAYWVPVDDDLYMHYAFDITERKAAERALARSQERLDVALHASGRAYLCQSGSYGFAER